ncbi:3-oxo-5-alpha-steroid 4-dehydrogenase-domain-containing protein [Mycena rebaudengoi]|nr:3-oxo-5-alpha-steroid 4-dehydrogenase-domain-containing protein [Mycena rebaudengoi]
MFGMSPPQLRLLYGAVRKWFAIGTVTGGPAAFWIDAPFGRFSPAEHNIFFVDGIKSWILMELVSPTCFIYALLNSPLSGPRFSLGSPQSLLAGAYLIHYLNRSLISPLRTPSRSKSHIMVPLAAVLFNTCNGSLMGSFLSSPSAPTAAAYTLPTFWIGLVLWAVGFVGNVVHDEVLLNIRRNANSKGKGKGKENGAEHYAIPHGLLYRFISFPNYFCEWVEWFGFALAADPRLVHFLVGGGLSLAKLVSLDAWTKQLTGPASDFMPLLSPPWVFFVAELATMFPRAYKGHYWYKSKFRESYPKERKIIVPFLL